MNFYGVSRETADLDLLVCRELRKQWAEFLSGFGYATLADRDNFMQLTPPKDGAWPVDLMFVNGQTFEKLLGGAVEVRMFDCSVKIPCLEHLLALKLHALKYTHVGRYSKDLLDVEGLVRQNKIDLTSKKYRKIFLKHGTLQIYEQISRFTAGGEC